MTGNRFIRNMAQRELFQEIEPYHSDFLKVSDIHNIYYEESGKKDGNPIVFVHGGPGWGCSPIDRRYFDPTTYRIILFDQRGGGKSTPAGEVKDNTLWNTLDDMEKLREHLKIDTWVVFGGSWGSTISLAYAETHPDKVKALVLRGILTCRSREIKWMYQCGASILFPDKVETYIESIPEVERGDIIGAYYRQLNSNDSEKALRAARSWVAWELSIVQLLENEHIVEKAKVDKGALQFARLACHHCVHGAFLKSDTQLLDNVDRIRHIPCSIVQGRYDVVCPMENAWLLHEKWPEAELSIVPDAGHSAQEPGIASKLIEATEKYKHL